MICKQCGEEYLTGKIAPRSSERITKLEDENARLTAELAGKSAVVDRIESEFALACEKFATERDALATELDLVRRNFGAIVATNESLATRLQAAYSWVPDGEMGLCPLCATDDSDTNPRCKPCQHRKRIATRCRELEAALRDVISVADRRTDIFDGAHVVLDAAVKGEK